jgi:Fe-S cluster biogenesis protein NfuA
MDIENQIKEVLDKIRPYLQRDGGDVAFDHMDSEGRVYVRMFGACVGCGAIDTTIKGGIEALLLEEVYGVSEVIVIE